MSPIFQNMFINFIMRMVMSALESSEKTRDIVVSLLDGAARMAAITATTIDDVVVRLAQAAVANDETWDMVWAVIQKYLDPDIGLDAGSVEADPQIVALANKLGDDTKIDPITIIALIMQIIEWIREWRNR